MRFTIGIHPHWHRRVWLLAFLLAALALLFTHRPTGGRAFAMEPDPSSPAGETSRPDESGAIQAPDAASPSTAVSTGERPAAGYVAEVVDSSYLVGPAEFFALDLPTNPPGAKAVHLFGTVTTKKGKDIIVRLFRASDYDRWLKQKSGVKPQAMWTSPRSRTLTLDQELPPGEPVVLLLDNGYSIRTPKQVSCQLQLRYSRNPTETFDTQAGTSAAGLPKAGDAGSGGDNLPAPRPNTEQELPPPPPPPPQGY